MTTETRTAATNRRLAKVAVQCSADTFVVNQIWFSASTFVVKIATFAKRQNVGGHAFVAEFAQLKQLKQKN